MFIKKMDSSGIIADAATHATNEDAYAFFSVGLAMCAGSIVWSITQVALYSSLFTSLLWAIWVLLLALILPLLFYSIAGQVEGWGTLNVSWGADTALHASQSSAPNILEPMLLM
jgi:hypothetical protein